MVAYIKRRSGRIILAAGVCLWLGAVFSAQAANLEDQVGFIKALEGKARIEHPDGQSTPAETGEAVFRGDRVVMMLDAAATLTFFDESELALGSGAEVQLDEFLFTKPDEGMLRVRINKGVFKLQTGEIASIRPDGFEIRLPSGKVNPRTRLIAGEVAGSRSLIMLLSPGQSEQDGGGHVLIGNQTLGGWAESTIDQSGYAVVIEKRADAPSEPFPMPSSRIETLLEGLPGDTVVRTPEVEQEVKIRVQKEKEEKEAGLKMSNPAVILPPRVDGEGAEGTGKALPGYSDELEKKADIGLDTIFVVCGDGVYDPGEECDDGNVKSRDGCSEFCKLEYRELCGNGMLDSGEKCDDGNVSDNDGCSATCQHESFCGDGKQTAGEGCDDGNRDSKDGCSSSCQVESARVSGDVAGREQEGVEGVTSSLTTDNDSDSPETDRATSSATPSIYGSVSASPSPTPSPSPSAESVPEPVDEGSGCVTRLDTRPCSCSEPACSCECTYEVEICDGFVRSEIEMTGMRTVVGGTYTVHAPDHSFSCDCATGQPGADAWPDETCNAATVRG